MTTWFPIEILGWITVPSPITAVLEIETFENWKGLKCFVKILKSRNGSSDITMLYLQDKQPLYWLILVAADCNALS
jgi:hypothetical protein